MQNTKIFCYLNYKLTISTLCPKKNIPNIFDCNVKNDYRTLIIFGTNISETTCRQPTI